MIEVTQGHALLEPFLFMGCGEIRIREGSAPSGIGVNAGHDSLPQKPSFLGCDFVSNPIP